MILLADNTLLELARDIVKNHFINTVSLRFIIFFLVVLLVRIAISAYKYNIRMKHFYLSRKIALRYSGVEDLERVKTFADTYSTDKIDFILEDVGGNSFWDGIKSMFGK